MRAEKLLITLINCYEITAVATKNSINNQLNFSKPECLSSNTGMGNQNTRQRKNHGKISDMP